MKLAGALQMYPSPLYVEIGRLIFIWGGGPYIDIWTRNDDFGVVITDININVWDYEANKAIIPFTPEALINEAIEWIDAY